MLALNKLFFTNSAKVEMLSDMAELLGEGMSVVDIAKDFERFGKGAVADLGRLMLGAVGQGRAVSTAFEGYFNEITVQTMLAGELSKDLRGGCINAQVAIQNTGGVAGTILKAVAGPLIQLFLITGVIVALSANIFPILSELIPQYMWPAISKSFHAFVTSISDNWQLVILSIFLVPYLFVLFLKNYTGPGRDLLDTLPGFSQFRYVVSAQVMYTMATVLRAGGSLAGAIEFAGKSTTRYQANRIALLQNRLGQAQSPAVGDIMDIGLLNERELNRLKVMASANRGNALRLQRAAEAHTLLIEKQMKVVSGTLRALAMASAVMILLSLLASILLLVMQARSAMT
ncbi:type II secretion system F family protein [Vibrio mediterranei]|uniref:type II secretion system F family protein n=1 Tax=Vibrio mediterranei TaxID=689 RepID=UPI00406844E8